MTKRNYGIILTSLFAVFCQTCFTFANPSPGDLKIPGEFGTVQEVFEPKGEALNVKKTIIQIQDAHCNYEAQKNMVRILEQLIKEDNLRLILVEGGGGDVSLSFLRNYGDKKKREEVADDYLRRGEISGEEYLDIVSDFDIELFGIEDEKLYDDNLNNFLQFDSMRQQAIGELESLNSIVAGLKPYLYNSELLDLEARTSGYAKKEISLVDYCGYLKETAAKKNMDLSDKQNLTCFLESAKLEKQIDLKVSESQRNEFIKALATKLDELGVKELIANTQGFKDKKIPAVLFYTFLKDMASGKIDLARDYPQLDSYISYIVLSNNLDVEEFLKEIGLIEKQISETLFVKNDQRKLYEISASLDMISKLLSLGLMPEEYEIFKENKGSLVTASWINFLTDNCRRYNLAGLPAASDTIDNNLDQFESFYTLGVEREKAFIRNIRNKMEESKDTLAVLITGGFHTPGISRLLKEEGYSYAVVTPAVTGKSDNSIYLSVLRGQKYSDLEKYSEEEDYEPWEE